MNQRKYPAVLLPGLMIIAIATPLVSQGQDAEIIVRVSPASKVDRSLLNHVATSSQTGDLPWTTVADLRPLSSLKPGAAKMADEIVAYVVTLPDGTNADESVAMWASVPGVNYAQRNRSYSVDGFARTVRRSRTDPLSDSLEHHAVVNIAAAWRVTTGADDVRVAFVDTGVFFDHPDLANSFWINPGEDANNDGQFTLADLNGRDDDGNGWVDDIRGFDFVDRRQSVEALDYRDRDPDAGDDGSGHGTTIAGVIGARRDNGEGIAGIAPSVSLVALRAFGADGRGDDDDIAAAIIYAGDMGFDVVNLSFGDSYYSPLMHEAIRYAVNRGTIVVASAGNVGGDDPHYPSDYPETISTVWLTEDGLGPAGRATYGSGVDIGAPGSSVFTTLQPFPADGAAPFDEQQLYGRQSGSSVAAPMVSATAALIRSVDPDLGVGGVRNAILGSATDIGSPGWDHRTGSGLLNVGAAVRRALPSRVELISPVQDGGGHGEVAVVGTVLHPSLNGFGVDYAFGSDELGEVDFQEITPLRKEQVVAETLAVWNTTALDDGLYTVRVRAVLLSGQTIEDRRRYVVDSSPPIVDVKAQHPALAGGAPAYFVDFESDDLVGATLMVPSSSGDTLLVRSDRLGRRHGLVLRNELFDGLSTDGTLVVRNVSGLESIVNVPLNFPSGQSNPSVFERSTLPLRHGFLYSTTTDFDGDGLREIVYNAYGADGQLGDTVRVAESPDWVATDMLFSNVFPRDVGDTDGDGRMELLGQVSGATVLFEAASSTTLPADPIFVDTTGLSNPTSGESLWGARLFDTDGDGLGEIIGHNTVDYRLIERRSIGFVESARLHNPTATDNSELSANGLAQPELLVTDLDGDGLTDVLFGDTDGDWILWEATSNDQFVVRWTFETDRYNAGRQFASGESANLGRPWFASSTTNWLGQRLDREHEPDATIIYVFQASGDNTYDQRMSFAVPGEIDSHSTLAAIDVHGDGPDELVVVAAPDLYVVDVSGSSPEILFHSNQLADPVGAPTGIRSAKVVVDDVDNDGNDELVVGTASGRFELWKLIAPQPSAPAILTAGYALNATTVFVRWSAPGVDSVSVVSRTGTDQFNTDTTIVGASVEIARTEEREYAALSWSGGNASELSNRIYIRPHDPAELLQVEVLSDRQVALHFDRELGALALDSRFEVPSYSGVIRPSITRRSIILGFDEAIADSVFWSGIVDNEGTPVADKAAFVNTKSMGNRQLIVSTWDIRPPDQIEIVFNQSVDVSSATNAANYTVRPFGRIEGVNPVDEGIRAVVVTVSGVAIGASGLDSYLELSDIVSVSGSELEREGSVISLSRTAEDLTQAYVFPNPLRPTHDHATIAGLPRGSSVEVFASDGVRIRSLTELDGNGGVDWDLRDEQGAVVPSGIYLLRVSSNGSPSVILKAAVIR